MAIERSCPGSRAGTFFFIFFSTYHGLAFFCFAHVASVFVYVFFFVPRHAGLGRVSVRASPFSMFTDSGSEKLDSSVEHVDGRTLYFTWV